MSHEEIEKMPWKTAIIEAVKSDVIWGKRLLLLIHEQDQKIKHLEQLNAKYTRRLRRLNGGRLRRKSPKIQPFRTEY